MSEAELRTAQLRGRREMSAEADRRTVVVICHNPMVGHVLLNTLHDAGLTPWLIYDKTMAASLGASRLIRGTVLAARDLAAHKSAVISAINQSRADLVMAADVEGQLLLHDIAGTIDSQLYPIPSRDTLIVLNDKQSFHGLCQRLGLQTPKTLHVADKRQIHLHLQQISREIGYPLVLKPTSKWGSMGFRICHSPSDVQKWLDAPSYQFGNLQVQQFITGNDIGIGLYATDGLVQASATFVVHGGLGTQFQPIPALETMARRIIASTQYTGIANFDGRLDVNGQVWLLECNPRFFMRLNIMQLCGLDLLAYGLSKIATGVIPTGNFYARADLATQAGWRRLLTGQWPVRRLMQAVGHDLRDPLPLVLRRFGKGAIKQAW